MYIETWAGRFFACGPILTVDIKIKDKGEGF